MKTGRSLQDIAAELERQHTTRKDYVAPQGAMTATVVDADVHIESRRRSRMRKSSPATN